MQNNVSVCHFYNFLGWNKKGCKSSLLLKLDKVASNHKLFTLFPTASIQSVSNDIPIDLPNCINLNITFRFTLPRGNSRTNSRLNRVFAFPLTLQKAEPFFRFAPNIAVSKRNIESTCRVEPFKSTSRACTFWSVLGTRVKGFCEMHCFNLDKTHFVFDH